MSTVLPSFPPSAAVSTSPMSAKEAHAEARAAKARAKAMRPWYRKKRFIFALLIVVVIGIVIAASAGSKDSSGTSSGGVTKGIGSADASADVSGATLGQPDAVGFRAVTLTVTNHSSKRSNYLIQMSIESVDGKTQYDTSMAVVNNLEAGQTTTPSAFPITKTVPAGAVVKIQSVQRLASN
jgi:hypothetical protein